MDHRRTGKILCATLAAATYATATGQEPPSREPTKAQRRAEFERRQIAKITAIVRGRCLDSDTGKPLVACQVTGHCWGGSRGDSAPAALRRPKPVITDKEGRFELRLLARADYQAAVKITRAGRSPRQARWRNLIPGGTTDIGDVRMSPGVYARGKIVDKAGDPMAGVSLSIAGVETTIDAQRQPNNPFRALLGGGSTIHCRPSAKDGTFQSIEALPPGTYRLRLFKRGISLMDPSQGFIIPKKGPMKPISIAVTEMPSISGVVVDASGRPMPGVYLGTETRGRGRSASAKTGKDGTFKIYKVENSLENTVIRIDEPGPGEPREPTKKIAWGSKSVRIQMTRALTMPIKVVEAGTDRPIESFAVRCYPTHGVDSSTAKRLRHSGSHPKGRLIVHRVRRGPGKLVVVPKDAHLLPAEHVIHGKKGMPEVQVEVRRLVPMKIRLTDAKGEPVANALVQVIVPGSHKLMSEELIVNPRNDAMAISSGDHTRTFDTEIFRAMTDPAGQSIVHGIDGRRDLILRVSGIQGQNPRRIENVAFGKQNLSRSIRL